MDNFQKDFKGNIAICGKIGSGKSNLAKVLVNNFGYTKFSFATPLKMIVSKMLGDEIERPREILQLLGMWLRTPINEINEIDRQKVKDLRIEYPVLNLFIHTHKYIVNHENFFLKMLEQDNDFKNAVLRQKAVIDDLRFVNESEFLREFEPKDKQLEFKIVRLKLDEDIRQSRLKLRDGDKYSKEHDLNDSELELDSIKSDIEIYTSLDIPNQVQRLVYKGVLR